MNSDKAVLWDLDGTILDSISVYIEVIEELFPAFGLRVLERDEIRGHFYGPIQDALGRMSEYKVDQAKLLSAFLEAQLHHYEDPLTHEGISDTIRFFYGKGLKQAVVTSRGSKNLGLASAPQIVRTLKHELHIPVVITADDTPYHKPHPGPIQTALRKLGVDPADAVMIGDQAVDTQAARAAGAYSIFIDHEHTDASRQAAKSAVPDLVCEYAPELEDGVLTLLGV